MMYTSRAAFQRLWKDLSLTSSSPLTSTSLIPWRRKHSTLAATSPAPATSSSTTSSPSSSSTSSSSSSSSTSSSSSSNPYADLAVLGAAVSLGSLLIGAVSRSLDFKPTLHLDKAQSAPSLTAHGGSTYSSMVYGYWDVLKSKLSQSPADLLVEDSENDDTAFSIFNVQFLRNLFSKPATEGALSFQQQQSAARYLSEAVLSYIVSRMEELPRLEPFWEDLNLMTPLDALRCALEEASDYLSPRHYDLSLLDTILNDATFLDELTRREHAMALKVSALIESNPSLIQQIDEKVFAAHWFARNLQPVNMVQKDTDYFAALHSFLTAFCQTEDPKLQRILKKSISSLSYWAKVSEGRQDKKEEELKVQDILWGGMAEVIMEAVRSPDPQVALDALHALASFSESSQYGERIVANGGLALVRKVIIENFNRAPSPAQRLALSQETARLLANVALSEKNHVAIIAEGFLPIIKNWAQATDLSLQSQGKRALLNLSAVTDHGSTSKPKPQYQGGLFLLSEMNTSEDANVDVVFVHGLLGGAFVTWRFDDGSDNSITLQTDSTNAASCWPKDLLAKEFPSARILALDFQTALSEWTSHPSRSAKSLLERSQEFLEKLEGAQVGVDRPVVFVAHSMGGLLVKQMLLQAQADPKRAILAQNTKGVVFYSTPHNGSWLSNYFQTVGSVLRLSIEVVELASGSKLLLDLNERFRNVFGTDRSIVSLGETVETALTSPGKKKDEATGKGEVKRGPLDLTVMVVPTESSHPGYGQFVSVPKDHVQICKPSSHEDAVYLYPKALVASLTQSKAN